MTLGRPVIWAATRTEDMATLSHSRAQIQYAELGCKRDGTFTGLRVHLVGDAGAYPGIGAFLPAGTRRMSNGTYRFPAIQFDVAVAVTNTTPTGAYRGAGRPEATALLERLVDHAAHELGIDPIELRRRNLLADDVFPFTTLTGVTYDTGRYTFPLDEAARFVGYDELRAEQRARRDRGDRDAARHRRGRLRRDHRRRRGQGVRRGRGPRRRLGDRQGRHVGPRSGPPDRVRHDRLVRTGIPMERIRLVEGDTDLVRTGGGTGGSRSLQLGGSAVHKATEAMVDKAKHLAAHLLEADVDDIVVDTDAGTVGVAGVPARALDWGALGRRRGRGARRRARPRRRHARSRRPARLRPGRRDVPVRRPHRRRRGRPRHRQGDAPAPRRRRRLRHGAQPAARRGPAARRHRRRHRPGAVRGGRASTTTATRSPATSPTTASPPPPSCRASRCTPPRRRRRSTRSAPRASARPARSARTPAVQNAVIDALGHLGVRHLDMPCTSEPVWQAIDAARRGDAARPVARAAGRLRQARRRPGDRRGRPQRRRGHLTVSVTTCQPATSSQRARWRVSKKVAWSVITFFV